MFTAFALEAVWCRPLIVRPRRPGENATVNLFNSSVRTQTNFWAIGLAVIVLCSGGCAAPEVSTAEDLASFHAIGPVQPLVDREQLLKARIPVTPYRVVPDDLLDLEMPEVLRAIFEVPVRWDDRLRRFGTFACRVNQSGAISLPAVGQINVAGKTLSEIESAVAQAYYPKFVKDRPAVVARIEKYRTVKVSIVGAVEEPGIYELRSDEMSLVSVLMKAGGIIEDGAGVIRIRSPENAADGAELALPMKGLKIPFADVMLKGGETVEVERLDPQFFAVIGLVNKPGAFPYFPGTKLNVFQAVAFAGGFDDVADPHYLQVHRQDPGGRFVSVAVRISEDGSTVAANAIPIKPGDLITVDHTMRTRMNKVLAEILTVQLGAAAVAR